MSVVDASTASPYNGPILASAMVYVGMYGIAVCQSFDYFQWYQDDPWVLKLLVAWEMAMGSAHAAFIFKTTWYKCIQGWGDDAIMYNTDVFGNLMNLTTLMMVVPSQCFFASIAYRALGRNLWYLGLIGALITLVAASGLALVIELLWVVDNWMGLPKALPSIYLWTLLVVEILTAAVLCLWFRSLKKGAGDESRALLTKFFFLSLRTSSATTVVALWERIEDTTGHSLLGQTPGLILAGVVLTSVLHTLNSRKQLQRMASTTERRYNTNNPAGWRSTKMNDVERGTATQVRVDTIVLQELDEPRRVDDFAGKPKPPFAPGGTVESL